MEPAGTPDAFSKNTHAFIIKLWLEEPPTDSRPALWRGYIAHAYHGERCYFQDMSVIEEFIKKYLEQWERDE